MKHWHAILIALLLACWSTGARAQYTASPSKIAPVLAYDAATGTSEPYFPVGWYVHGVVPPATVEEIAATGSNTVLFAGVWDQDDWHFGTTKASLDKAQGLGLKIILAFHHNMLIGVDAKTPDSYKHLQRWVEAYRDHPALLGWQLGDENGGPLTAEMVQSAAQVIKGWDPHHQIWQVFSINHTQDNTIAYMKGTDVYSLDFYQYLDGRGIFGGTDGTADVYLTRAQWARTYGWAGAVNVTQAIGSDSIHLSEYRFPNADEYRWNVFNGIASARARGTLNWIYFYGPNYYTNVWQFYYFRDEIVAPVTREQLEMAHALNTGWNVGRISSNFDHRVKDRTYAKIAYLMLHDDQKNAYYLIVTNNTADTMQPTLKFEDLPHAVAATEAGIARESRSVKIDKAGNVYTLTDELPPFGVTIYTIPSQPGK